MTFKLARLYDLGAWGAAGCMISICGLVALQVMLRCIDGLLVFFGLSRLGLGITGVSEIAAYLLVGATGLGLAYTFVHQAHIRVTLLVARLPSAIRAWTEAFCLAVALALTVALTAGLIQLIGESIEFQDVSSGFLSIPLWIPQTVLVVGVGLLCLALLEALAVTLKTAVVAPSSYRAEDSNETGEDDRA
ncbi:TRAP transporter small permease [Aidingimonas lacisalsi]|uniref:TRAP transporter small permease n=1 Tax=Aidingimonas lacisalsi TaxID=2604086 RepID=UPI0011D25DEA|nr:TRAP transporter small permease [Aidingimonas lacisalsi]